MSADRDTIYKLQDRVGKLERKLEALLKALYFHGGQADAGILDNELRELYYED